MIQLNITRTKLRKMPPPAPVPELTEQEARSWFSGWWYGMAIGLMSGVGIGVLLAGAFQ